MRNKLIRVGRRIIGSPAVITGRSVGRIYTRDAQAIQFRMPAGFSGDVNRTHPQWVEAVSMDATNPPTYFGQAGVIDATSHLFRTVLAGDGALTDIYGVTVRPFPFQQGTTTNFGAATIGSAAPSTVNKLDVLRAGYIMAQLNNFAAAPSAKGGRVWVWIAATIANHVQGSFEAADGAGNTIELPVDCTFNGAPDATGIVEVIIHA